MSKYARVIERISTSISKATGADTGPGLQLREPAEPPASTMLPGHGPRRQELERLRSAVVLAHQLQGVQTILICGSRQDDGATAVSVDLALTLAEMDRTPVALADVTGVRPGIEAFLKAALPGRHLKEVLPQGTTVSVQQTRVRNFYLVGDTHGSMSLMSLLQPVDLLRRLRERFKFVILNAPPVVVHPDTALLATKVDGVMLVAQTNKSRLEELSAAKTEFERVNANILGVVLSQRKEHLPKLLADRV